MSTVHFRDKVQTDTSDTGVSVRPILDGELVEASVLNRPGVNLKSRTEEIQRYLNVRHKELALESTRRISLVAVQADGELYNYGGMVKIFKDNGAYFVEPGNLNDPNNLVDNRVLIISGENSGAYSLKREAFTSFYTDGVQDGYNPSRGLSDAGHTLYLKVPRYSSTELSGIDKAIPASSSTATAIREASIGSSLESFLLNDGLDSAADGVLHTSPSINKWSVTLRSTSNDFSGFQELIDSTLESLSVTISYSDNSNDRTYSLDHLNVYYDSSAPETVHLYLSTYELIPNEMVSDTIDALTFYEDGSASSYTFTASDGFTSLEPLEGIRHPYDYFIPLMVHTGDRLSIPGVGSVLVSEVDRISALGYPVMMRGDGKVLSSITDGEVVRGTIQHVVTVPVEATNDLTYSENIALPVDPTLVNSGYTVESIEIYEKTVPSGASGNLVVYYTDTNTNYDYKLFNAEAYGLSIVTLPTGKILVPKLSTAPFKSSDLIEEGEVIKVLISDAANLVEGIELSFRVNYIQLLG